jgi:hypothetical protein
MHIAILTFEGFNELDSLIALGILNRVKKPDWRVSIASPAGGCLASQYLAAWVIARLEGVEAAASAMHYVASVGEKEEYVARAMRNIAPFLEGTFAAA